MFEFMGQVGNDMTIGVDVEAFEVLKNGEQGDGSESSPIIGTEDGSTFAFKDIRRTVARMRRLRHNATRIITSEDDGIDISLLEEFKGFDGPTTLAQFNSILGVPDSLINDVFTTPDDQVMLVAPGSAMIKLKHKTMKVETDREARNQQDLIFVTDYVGFAIKRRDGRVLVDKSELFSGLGFPAFMDIDSRISQAFKNKNEV